MRTIFLGLFLSACSGGSHPPPPPPPPPAPVTYDAAVARLPTFYQYGGWVISLGAQDNHDDSLIFTGLALYGMPCAEGEPIAAALESMLQAGSYIRYPGDGGQVGMDGLLGLYRGVNARIDRCGEHDRWAAAFQNAPDPSSVLPLGFDFVRQALMAKLGLGAEPDGALKGELEKTAGLWTLAVNAAHAACFRAHLSLLALQTVDELGRDADQTDFCAASRGLRIATADEYCGRGGLQNWLDTFRYDVWEYAHQRCPSWESPDGKGDRQPAVDYLVAHQDLEGQ